MKHCTHPWRVKIDYRRPDEHKLCLTCDERIRPIKVTKREK